MHALEGESLAIFKVARRLENPAATPKDLLPGQTAWISVSWLAAHTHRVA